MSGGTNDGCRSRCRSRADPPRAAPRGEVARRPHRASAAHQPHSDEARTARSLQRPSPGARRRGPTAPAPIRLPGAGTRRQPRPLHEEHRQARRSRPRVDARTESRRSRSRAADRRLPREAPGSVRLRSPHLREGSPSSAPERPGRTRARRPGAATGTLNGAEPEFDHAQIVSTIPTPLSPSLSADVGNGTQSGADRRESPAPAPPKCCPRLGRAPWTPRPTTTGRCVTARRRVCHRRNVVACNSEVTLLYIEKR